ncbi:DEAD/DEAH box helicase [Candidatus Pacearchaeota archaeon]|nr:MAG: DEAD/DEAH box helicase [Candidatus Pacearchaeota archaeon]
MKIKISPREYQQSIFNTAKQKNTLVVLPTGLGKTLIALMLAVERLEKFPDSKVLFLAPTKPLVEQHLSSFKKNLAVEEKMCLFTGMVKPKERQRLFNECRIIFSTPQCVANDLDKGLYNLANISLLVIDEAHRCLKNYDYTKVVRAYKEQAKNQRVLGLTASPGHEPEKVREICEHLSVEEIEIRTRESPEVKKYLQHRDFTKVVVEFPPEFLEIKQLLKKIYDSRVDEIQRRNLIYGPVNKITLLELQSKLINGIRQGNKSYLSAISLTAQAIKISHALELLETQTLKSLHDYLSNLASDAKKKTSKAVQTLTRFPEFQLALRKVNELIEMGKEHPKVSKLVEILDERFSDDKNTKAIVFTQYRDSALRILKELKKLPYLKAEKFFGQAKRNNGGLTQKEQKEIIDKLNKGEINCLVSTSIGEEGLDIAEVNLVVFYEPIPSAIRKIQREGRTARLSPGSLVILVTTNTRDVAHHYAARARERKMYRTITKIKEELKESQKTPKTLLEFS